MYIIKYEQNSIYAGTWNDTEGSYLYASNSLNKQKPKVFKTLKGVQNHINKLLNKIPYPSESKLRFEEWSDEDLKKHLISIGIDPIEEKSRKQKNEKEKYWKKVFKPIKGEIEVTKIRVCGNEGTVIYLMPYSEYDNVFTFQADLDKEIVILAFCSDVIRNGQDMCQTIKECTGDVINLFKKTTHK